jgi:fucose 4-O-acetylase-like acetyltransferase
MYSHSYGNYAIAFVGACCGSIASLILVSYSIRRSKWLTTFVSWFGRNSLLLFPLHLLVLNTMAAVQSVIHIPLGLRFFILVGVCIPLANLITRYLPVLAGRGLFPRALKKDSCIPS